MTLSAPANRPRRSGNVLIECECHRHARIVLYRYSDSIQRGAGEYYYRWRIGGEESAMDNISLFFFCWIETEKKKTARKSKLAAAELDYSEKCACSSVMHCQLSGII